MKKLIFVVLLIITTTVNADRVMDCIKGSEGFRADPYMCSAGRWTIGYGTLIDTPYHHHVDEAEATWMLRNRVVQDRAELNKRIFNFDRLPIEVIIATHSAYYNSQSLIGPNYCKYVQRGDWERLSLELAYNHAAYKSHKGAQGLLNRRIKEANLIREYANLELLPECTVSEYLEIRKHM